MTTEGEVIKDEKAGQQKGCRRYRDREIRQKGGILHDEREATGVQCNLALRN